MGEWCGKGSGGDVRVVAGHGERGSFSSFGLLSWKGWIVGRRRGRRKGGKDKGPRVVVGCCCVRSCFPPPGRVVASSDARDGIHAVEIAM